MPTNDRVRVDIAGGPHHGLGFAPVNVLVLDEAQRLDVPSWKDQATRLKFIADAAHDQRLPEPVATSIDRYDIELQIETYAELEQWAEALCATIEPTAATTHQVIGEFVECPVQVWFGGVRPEPPAPCATPCSPCGSQADCWKEPAR